MADDTKKNTKAAAGKALVARVALKGDFDALDGLGTAMQEIPAGTKFSTDDTKLAKSLVDQGYAKSAKDADKDEEETVDGSGSNPPKIETTETGDGKKDGKK